MSKNSKKVNRKIDPETGVLYPVFLTDETRLHVQDGNRKLGKGIYTINLLPGSGNLTLKDGTVLTNVTGSCGGCCDACQNDCYAINGAKYHHNSVIPSTADNTLLARFALDSYFQLLEMFIKFNFVACIRMHSSGEFLSYEYFKRFVEFSKKHPDIKFYTYTKRFNYIERYIEIDGGSVEDLDGTNNFTLNVSIWHKNYSNPYGLPEFIYDDGTEPELKNIPHCPAVDENGNETGITCSACRSCPNAKHGTRRAVYAH